MRFLLIGHSAREHAIAKRLIREGHVVVSYMVKQNVGLENVCHAYVRAQDYSCNDIISAAIVEKIDLILPSDEAALFGGVADAAVEAGIACFGHTKKTAALIELARDEVIATMPSSRYVRVPDGKLVRSHEEIRSFAALRHKIAVKPLRPLDGSFSQNDRGVTFVEDAESSIDHLVLPAWVEPYQSGVDFSIHYMVNGSHYHYLGLTFDYPFLDDTCTILTGGMGAIVPSDADKSVVSPVLLSECQAMAEKCFYKLQERYACRINGFVSLQFRKVRQQAIFTELDCKPGNPEIVALLPTLIGEFGESIMAITKGELPSISSSGKASVALSMASPDYPSGGAAIKIPDTILSREDVSIGETIQAASTIRSGRSRTLCVVESGEHVKQVLDIVLSAAREIKNNTGLIFRDDIGAHVFSLAASRRVHKSLLELKQKGGKRFMLRLSPEANEALKQLVASKSFPSETMAINWAIIMASKISN